MTKSIFRKAIVGVVMAAGVALTVLPVRADSTSDLKGTWLGTVTILDCKTKATVNTFPALYSYVSDGVMLTTDGLPAPEVKINHQGSSQGTWQVVRGSGNKQFTETFVVFTFHPDGTWFGHNKVTGTITLSDDKQKFTSATTFEIFDGKGNLIGGGCGADVASRLK